MEAKDPLNTQLIELPNTIEGCHSLIRDLLPKLFKCIETLQIENRQLKERLNNNSSNSSLPPSKDFKKKKKKNPSSKNKAGGQKGHPGHFRALADGKEVDSVVECKLAGPCSCGGEIRTKKNFQRHQVHELPEIKLHITEYQ